MEEVKTSVIEQFIDQHYLISALRAVGKGLKAPHLTFAPGVCKSLSRKCVQKKYAWAGNPWIILEPPRDQWIGWNSGKDSVLGWMSMDNPRTSTGPVDLMGQWERQCTRLDVHG